MNSNQDFDIWNKYLKEYRGTDENVFVPDGVKRIANRAFMESEITSVVLPESVVEINGSAFYDCKKLKSIKITENVARILPFAFMGCEALEEINLSDSMVEVSNSCFEGCAKLNSINIPKSANIIGEKAFKDCISLDKVLIPSGVEKIGKEAFKGCSSLSYISIPDSVTEISGDLFDDCNSNLLIECSAKTYQLMGNVNLFWYCYDNSANARSDYDKIMNSNKNKLIEKAIKEEDTKHLSVILSICKKITLEKLDDYSRKCKNISGMPELFEKYKNDNYSKEKQEKVATKIKANDNSEAVLNKLFKRMKKYAPNTIKGYKGHDDVVIIPSMIGNDEIHAVDYQAFSPRTTEKDCKNREARNNIKTVIISEGIVSVWMNCFEYCENLEKVVLPESMQRIGYRAFAECPKLKELYIPQNVNYIEAHIVSEGTVIHARKGSYAIEWAKENNVEYVEI